MTIHIDYACYSTSYINTCCIHVLHYKPAPSVCLHLHAIDRIALQLHPSLCICMCMGMAATNNVSSAMAPSSSTPTCSSRRWRSSLASGLRAALACTIVGLVSVYSPPTLRRHITFPAFSYVVTVIIVTDATVGTALRAAASALHATVMGAVPSVVALWLAHRTGAGESVLATATVVALSTFAVALPESPGPVAKRIALGQIIIIYVARFRRGEHPSHEFVLVHPANVVVCTALGVVAALLAVLLPCPRLATWEVADKSRAYMETAAERVRVIVDAFLVVNSDTTCAEDDADSDRSSTVACGRRRRWCMAACMSQAHRLASASAGLLQRISSVKGDLQWERVPRWWPAPPVADQLHDRIETPIKGMEIALTNSSSSSSMMTVTCSWLQQMRDQIRLALLTHHHHSSSSSSIKPSAMKMMNASPLLTTRLPQRHEELAPFLFLFSMGLLHRGTTLSSNPTCTKVTPAATQKSTEDDVFYLSDEEEEEEVQGSGGEEDQREEEQPAAAKTKEKKTKSKLLRWKRVMTAIKCAVSLGLAVLLGLLFNNDHGFWSGLIVATTMTAGRESTWALGIARAHGTAVGSFYGVLGCLLSQQRRLMELRFLALLPWIVLATFLKRSRAYGPAGGVAAALSGIIIVGRRYDEAPMAFTITRLVETFIGLSCTIAADLAFQPKARPSARARTQLGRCIAALRECCTAADDTCASGQQKQKVVQEQVSLLNKYAAEAGREPSFLWLAPFPTRCYDKVHGSLSRMTQLMGLYQHARAIIPTSGHGGDSLGEDINRFHGLLSASLEEMSKPISAALFEDLEAGGKRICGCCEEMAVVQSFLGHAREALQQQQQQEEEQQLAASCLGSIGFCMGELMKEAQQLEAHMLDLRLQQH